MAGAASVRTKICGLTRSEDVRAAVDAGADATGFVVDVPVETPRAIDADRAARLIATVPPFVSTVLVTFPDDVDALIERTRPDSVQVHGSLDPERLSDLGTAHDVEVIKTVGAGDHEAAHRYAPVADAVHVDSTDAAGGGGTGRTHDWAETATLVAQLECPVILSGGLTPENVAEAVRTVRPYGVDVSSGVEASGGIKDHQAVSDFVRNATQELTRP